MLVHCAAGIHRTGVFAYSLLRATGRTPKDTMLKILQLREVTHRGVGKDRVEGAEHYIVPPLLRAIAKTETEGAAEEEVKSIEAEAVSVAAAKRKPVETGSEATALRAGKRESSGGLAPETASVG